MGQEMYTVDLHVEKGLLYYLSYSALIIIDKQKQKRGRQANIQNKRFPSPLPSFSMYRQHQNTGRRQEKEGRR